MVLGHLLSPGSGLLIDDVIVPLEAVASVTHDTVGLSAPASEVRRMAPYLTYGYAPAQPGDTMRVILASVARWWGIPSSPEEVEVSLRGGYGDPLRVIEVERAIAGGVYYHEEEEPDYPPRRRRHLPGRVAAGSRPRA